MQRTDRRRVTRLLVVGLVASIVAVSGPPFVRATPATASTPAAGTVSEFGRTKIRAGWGITVGPDGNVWFTTDENDLVGRSTPSGEVTTFASPEIVNPRDITAGPDGNLWFVIAGTSASTSSIGRMTTAGVLTTFAVADVAETAGIAAGPDGNVWFALPGIDRIGRISPAGAVTTFTGPGVDDPSGIAAGPDGALWFVNRGPGYPDTPSGSIGRITADGSITSYTTPGLGSPERIVAGPDGALWFTRPRLHSVGRISTDGSITSFDDPLVGDYVHDITVGPDGALWILNGRFTGTNFENAFTRLSPSGQFTDHLTGSIYNGRRLTTGPDGLLWEASFRDLRRVSPAGALSRVSDSAVNFPGAMTTGHDGNIWFANQGDPSIVRVLPNGAMARFEDPERSSTTTMAAGPEGGVWYGSGSTVRRLTAAGVPVEVASISGEGPIVAMVGDPEGNVWFSTGAGTSIRRLSPTGALTKFTDASIAYPSSFTMGPDGAVWFTNQLGHSIGRITTAGAVSTLVLPAATRPSHIAAGADGALWFISAATEYEDRGYVSRITMHGQLTTFSDASAPLADRLVAGSDGTLWFPSWQSGTGVLGHVTVDGIFSVFDDPGIARPYVITAGADGGVWFSNGDFNANSIGRIQTAGAPSSPRAVHAGPGVTSATVTWVPPAASGSSVVTSYTVTASPGGAACTWTSGPLTCTVTGLAPGTTYTFTATATNAEGTSNPSSPSLPVTPGPGSTFHALDPVRILDTREAGNELGGALTASSPKTLTIAGQRGVPLAATAVVLNVTVTASDSPSFLTVWPSGVARPNSSNLNFGIGQTIANQVTTKIGADGTIGLATANGSVHVVADVAGYFDLDPGGDRFTPIAPERALDSRTTVGGWSGPLEGSRSLPIRGAGASPVLSIPPTATAIVANITVTNGTDGSFLTVAPDLQDPTGTSSINFGRDETIANLVTVGLGANGRVELTNAIGLVDVVVDVLGYYDPTQGSLFHAVTPQRMLDDRTGNGLVGPFLSQPRSLAVGGTNGIPGDASAVVANLTATNATAPSFASVYPHGVAPPNSSTLNFGAGQTIPNLTIVKLGTGGAIDLANQQGSVDLIADAVGYFAPY